MSNKSTLPELLPCPSHSCGSRAIYTGVSDGNVTSVCCLSCPLSMSDDDYTFEELGNMWNAIPRIRYSTLFDGVKLQDILDFYHSEHGD